MKNEETRRVFLPPLMLSFYPCKISEFPDRPEPYLFNRVIWSTECGKKQSEVFMDVSELNKFTNNLLVRHIR